MEERKCVGWQEQETSRLFSAVQEARGSGAPLRQVFEDLSVDLGRKPNSIRNYYYACLRNQEQNTPRVQAFIPFTEAETHDLLRQGLRAGHERSRVCHADGRRRPQPDAALSE